MNNPYRSPPSDSPKYNGRKVAQLYWYFDQDNTELVVPWWEWGAFLGIVASSVGDVIAGTGPETVEWLIQRDEELFALLQAEGIPSHFKLFGGYVDERGWVLRDYRTLQRG